MIRALSAAVVLSMTIALAQTNRPHPNLVSTPIYTEPRKAPKKAASRQNPLDTDSSAVPASAELFDLHCVQCHRQMAQGGKQAPSLQTDEVQQASHGTLFWLLTNGVVGRGLPV